MISVLRVDDEHKAGGMLAVKGAFEEYLVWGDVEDYTEQTSDWMQQLVKKTFRFPMYVHFESYYDNKEWILPLPFELRYKPAGRTILTMSARKTFQAEVPAFTVKIPDEQTLQHAFSEWFHFGVQNNLFAITQEDAVYYERGFATIDLAPETMVLVTAHDAQGMSFITNHSVYQQEENLRKLLAEVIVE